VTGIVVVRTCEYTVDAPQVEAYVRAFVADEGISALATVAHLSRRFGAGLVSRDRDATMTPWPSSPKKERR